MRSQPRRVASAAWSTIRVSASSSLALKGDKSQLTFDATLPLSWKPPLTITCFPSKHPSLSNSSERKLARLALFASRPMKLFQLSGNFTSLLEIILRTVFTPPLLITRVPSLIERSSYRSKRTSILSDRFPWDFTVSMNESANSPNVRRPAGLPKACTNAIPSMIVQVFKSGVTGKSFWMTPWARISMSWDLLAFLSLPSDVVNDNGFSDSSLSNRQSMLTSRPASLAIRRQRNS